VMEGVLRNRAPEHFDAADFDNAMAKAMLKPGGFGIEHDGALLGVVAMVAGCGRHYDVRAMGFVARSLAYVSSLRV
jgi:hypothetical protein